MKKSLLLSTDQRFIIESEKHEIHFSTHSFAAVSFYLLFVALAPQAVLSN